ncbi:hypothetical protein GCM10017687_12290 [Streptomyces echinatus]|uniref:HTH luxR-type domain-containing protein n=1 Tax=Streptomyces echinatus TaxID=67293 RepID=A0A7W9Q0N7_9ACTN|nr:hypothetical protein [Streptomyces echinatus]
MKADAGRPPDTRTRLGTPSADSRRGLSGCGSGADHPPSADRRTPGLAGSILEHKAAGRPVYLVLVSNGRNPDLAVRMNTDPPLDLPWPTRRAGPRRRRPPPSRPSSTPRTRTTTRAAIGKHIGNILTKLDLPPTDRTHRGVLAVLSHLRA